MKLKYFVLVWEATDIFNFLQLPALDFALFNFVMPVPTHYKLSVTGFDVNRLLLSPPLILNKKPPAEPELDNLYPAGLFFVKKDELINYSVNGTKPLYFKPIAYTPPGGGTQQYVGYNIYNEAPVGNDFVDNALVASINPSPPRRANF